MSLARIGEFARMSRLSPKALRLYDELGLLVPVRVDPDTGYRWYAASQLDRARLVAALRRLGVPLAGIKQILTAEPAAATREIRAHMARAEAEHAARRALAGLLVHRLQEGRPAMDATAHAMDAGYEVAVRDLPARSLLGTIRRVHEEELIPVGRELFIRRLRAARVPRPEGVAGAPFMIYHGEVSGDSDGPVEWCWPVPDDRASEIASAYPDLTLRTEPAHQEAYVRPAAPGEWDSPARAELALRALATWGADQGREASGAVRLVLAPNPGNGHPGPEGQFAVPLR
jgi:DNA-binding transcriptional MerR regulator